METDQEVEDFLRRFRPRAPVPLPPRRRRGVAPLLAAAAAVAISLAGAWRFAGGHAPPEKRPSAPSAAALSRAAYDDPERLGAVLDEASAAALPDVGREDGSLRALAVLASDLGRRR